ncbi:MAG: zinc metallopeptidase [Bacteroidales bacterium]|nr:zinc metallopeptidase [Porphyromonas sp.]MDD7437514.1 zinc metallopeptidase [Bacteroidales bacterium]MDY3066471.1 zinc metallopeptidase [Porphyromonas sp.]
MPVAYMLMFGVMILGMLVQWNLKSKFKKFSQVRLDSGLTGREVAERMLREHGITDVQVISTAGQLTDHYNPASRTINLSEPVYNSNSVMAAAVAAHETGHAIQHAVGYAPLKMRSALVPVVQFSSNIVQWVLIAGIFLVKTFPQLLLAGIILFALTTLFSIVTLPVEVDASRRALAWLEQNRVTSYEQQPMAATALRSAAYTYFAAAIGSIATLLYYLSIYSGRR